MTEDLRVGRGLRIPAGELEIRFSRSGGPGGQNVNKRDTRVEVVLDVATSPSLSEEQRRRIRERLGGRIDSRGRLRVASSAARTQAGNRRRAMETLRALLGEALSPPPPRRIPTKPSAAARERRLAAKRARSETKRRRSRPRED